MYLPTIPQHPDKLLKISYSVKEIIPYINWIYFHFAWGLPHSVQQTPKGKEQTETLMQDAYQMLEQMDSKNYRLHIHAYIGQAKAEGEDIILSKLNKRIPFLRQQSRKLVGKEGSFRCMSDYILADGSDYMGIFSTTIDAAAESDFEGDPYKQMLAQTLCDRLAEAATEKMHLWIRTQEWGYAPDEELPISDLLVEHFQGIRPAIGYPSIPDQGINFILGELLDYESQGIHLTETGAMKPHASVTGLMIAHPDAAYFNIGPISKEQALNYAQRRGKPLETIAPYLYKNIQLPYNETKS
ncbi:MAG: vitamin B12 dependent-methionine synthase activation domain-containing protein [Bacteroidaceae bacterium]